jgi:mRNA interferase RelE/StbE
MRSSTAMSNKIEFIPEAVEDFDQLDGSVRKKVAKKIDELAENPYLGKPLGNLNGINLTGFFKLYTDDKNIRIVYRLLQEEMTIVEIWGIGKREKSKIYQTVDRRVRIRKKKK